MLRVGLTGSIAVGKSYVCSVFRELGCHVLDADMTAREVVRAGSVGLDRVVEAFGRDVLTSEGELDRKRLAAIVFSDERKLAILNSIVHPLVFEAQDIWLREIEAEEPGGIAIVDAALMIESGGYKRFDQLIVVWCEPEIQLQRLTSRDGLTDADARQRIAAQMSQTEKKRCADHLIDTSKGFDDTRRQTEVVFEKLKGFGF
ncbi:MAG TPA: dephospho-CoA kinase [Pyrinomonadaceae bacterium]|nr:dephospho-CoA kinase [Pyrinomonadaceae bacterium]